MDDALSLARFISDSSHHEDSLSPERLESLIHALCVSERPRSFRALFWLLLQTLQTQPALHAAVMEAWLPSEADLAQLLEDAGADGTRVVLSLESVAGQLQRLWQLCDQAGFANRLKTIDPWLIASLAPMEALYAERQLDALISAVMQERPWNDPAEILDSDGSGFDRDALIALAEARIAAPGGDSEALRLVLGRLPACSDPVH